MDELLGGLRQEGRHDSEGRFTLALEPAMRKLAERQFELPGLYLLKLIQAAVALEARAIRIKIRRAEVRFEADLDRPIPSQAVEELPRGPFGEFSSPGLRHLAWAWAAALSLDPHRVELQAGGRRLVNRQAPEEHYGDSFSLTLEKAALRWWQRLLPGRAAEHALVCRAAGYCPVPLVVDGLLVDGSQPRLGKWRRGKLKIVTTAFYQPITCDFAIGQRLVFRAGGRLSARPPLGMDPASVALNRHEIATLGTTFAGQPLVYSWEWPEPIEPIKLVGDYRPEHRQLEGAYLLGFDAGWDRNGELDTTRRAFLALPTEAVEPFLSPSQRRVVQARPLIGGRVATSHFRMPAEQRVPICWAHLSLPADQPDGTGWIYPCLHGVLLDPVEADLGCPGAVAVVTADHLDSDLSQLKLVEDERFERLVQDLRSEVADFAALLVGSAGVAALAEIDYLVRAHVQKRLTAS